MDKREKLKSAWEWLKNKQALFLAAFVVIIICAAIASAATSYVTDTFTDTSKIAASTDITVSGGQVKLKVNLPVGSSCTVGSECTSGYCYRDADADGYSVSGAMVCQASASLGTDCYDLNANAKPGQTAYYSTNRGDGSFDYNCSGAYETSNCSGYVCSLSAQDDCCTSYYNSCSNVAYTAPSCGTAWTYGTCASYVCSAGNYGTISTPYGTFSGCMPTFGTPTLYYCNSTAMTCVCH